MKFYKIWANRQKRTYTIRVYDKNGRLIAKYRTLPQAEMIYFWSQADIANYLRNYSNSGDYYRIK